MVLIGGRGALAAEPSDLPPIDPPNHWHVLTQDDASSDSKCIGNPVTPLCAVETIHACFTRRDDGLCQIAMGLDHLPGLSLANKRPELSERYHVVSATEISKKKRPPINGERPEVGDVILDVMQLYCRAQKCEPAIGLPTSYLVRLVKGRWVVVTWETPRW